MNLRRKALRWRGLSAEIWNNAGYAPWSAGVHVPRDLIMIEPADPARFSKASPSTGSPDLHGSFDWRFYDTIQLFVRAQAFHGTAEDFKNTLVFDLRKAFIFT